MPRIAQYEPNQVQSRVVQQPRASANVSPDAFGGPVLEGLTDVAQAGFEIKKRIDTTSAEEALTAFEREKNEIFFNPESGYFNTNGKSAFDNAQPALKSLEDLKKKHSGALGSSARLVFDDVASKHITRDMVDINKHASRGLQVWEIATLEAQVENSIESASLYWNNPERLSQDNISGRIAVVDSAEMSGIGQEALSEKLQTFDSSFAKAAVSAAMNNSASEGQRLLDHFGKRLEGPDRVALEASIKTKVETEKVESDGQKAVITATNLISKYDNRADAIEDIEKIEDADLRKKTMTEFNTQFSRKKQARSEEQNDHYQTVIGLVNDGRTAAEIQAVSAESWQGMSDIQRNKVLAGKHMVSDRLLLSDLRLLPTQQKANLNPSDYSDRLNPSDIQKLTTEVAAARRGDAGTQLKTVSALVNDAALNIFGAKSKWRNKRGLTNVGEKANSFTEDVQNAIDDFEAQHSRKIQHPELRSMLSDFTRDIVVQRSRMGFDVLRFDTELNLRNTPANHVRMMNRIIDDSESVNVTDLVDAYQYMIDEDIGITLSNLRNVYSQGTK